MTGSAPSSLSGGLAAARPRCLGWAKIASASSRVMVNSFSSLVDRAGVGALLQVGPVPAVERLDLLAVRRGADGARQGQQLERVLEGDRLRRHRGEQARRARGLLAALGHDGGDVGAVPAGLDHDRVAGLRVGAELAVAGRRARAARATFSLGQLVGGDVVGDADPGAVVAAGLQVGPVAADPHHDRLAVGAGRAQRDGVDAAGVDLLQPLADDLTSARRRPRCRRRARPRRRSRTRSASRPGAACRRRSRRARSSSGGGEVVVDQLRRSAARAG